jgi:hypothetical protein
MLVSLGRGHYHVRSNWVANKKPTGLRPWVRLATDWPNPLLQLLLVVVAGRLGQLVLDLLDAALDLLPLAGALDDHRVVLVDLDLLGAAQVGETDVFELDAEVLEDGLAAQKRGQAPFAGTALRVLRTNGACPLF